MRLDVVLHRRSKITFAYCDNQLVAPTPLPWCWLEEPGGAVLFTTTTYTDCHLLRYVLPPPHGSDLPEEGATILLTDRRVVSTATAYLPDTCGTVPPAGTTSPQVTHPVCLGGTDLVWNGFAHRTYRRAVTII